MTNMGALPSLVGTTGNDRSPPSATWMVPAPDRSAEIRSGDRAVGHPHHIGPRVRSSASTEFAPSARSRLRESPYNPSNGIVTVIGSGGHAGGGRDLRHETPTQPTLSPSLSRRDYQPCCLAVSRV